MSRWRRCAQQSPQGWSARDATSPAPQPAPQRVHAACSPPRRAERSASGCTTRQKAEYSPCSLPAVLRTCSRRSSAPSAACDGASESCALIVSVSECLYCARANLWRARPAPGEAAAAEYYTYAGARKRERGTPFWKTSTRCRDLPSCASASCGGHERERRGRGRTRRILAGRARRCPQGCETEDEDEDKEDKEQELRMRDPILASGA